MSRIFKDQSYLRIVLTTNVSLTGALEVKIYYRTPSGTVGSVTAEVSDETNGVIFYNMPTTSLLTETGLWRFWSYVKFSDSRIARGETVTERIYNEEDEE